MLLKIALLLACAISLGECLGLRFDGFVKDNATEKPWTGKWFPKDPEVYNGSSAENDNNHTVTQDFCSPDANVSLDVHKRIQMGKAVVGCDVGTPIEYDWPGDDFQEYTCFEHDRGIKPDEDVQAILTEETIPPGYVALHYCECQDITYDTDIPIFGAHRPLWPYYGEYEYLPPQRFLHSLEHGAVLMLYHPCANKREVDKLRQLVTGCLYRHVISPSKHLSYERPLALVTWGKRLEMSKVSERVVVRFIKENALRGFERTSRNGQYNYRLLRNATVVSDIDDTRLCPNSNY